MRYRRHRAINLAPCLRMIWLVRERARMECLNCDPFREEQRIANSRASRRHDPAGHTFPQQTAHHDRSSDRIGDLTAAAAQWLHRHDGRLYGVSGTSVRPKKWSWNGQAVALWPKTSRRGPCRREIIGIDQQGIGADFARDEGDRIGLRD